MGVASVAQVRTQPLSPSICVLAHRGFPGLNRWTSKSRGARVWTVAPRPRTLLRPRPPTPTPSDCHFLSLAALSLLCASEGRVTAPLTVPLTAPTLQWLHVMKVLFVLTSQCRMLVFGVEERPYSIPCFRDCWLELSLTAALMAA